MSARTVILPVGVVLVVVCPSQWRTTIRSSSIIHSGYDTDSSSSTTDTDGTFAVSSGFGINQNEVTGNPAWNDKFSKARDVGTATNWLDGATPVTHADVNKTAAGAGMVNVNACGVVPGTLMVDDSNAGAYTFAGGAINGASFNKLGVGALFLTNTKTDSGNATLAVGVVTIIDSPLITVISSCTSIPPPSRARHLPTGIYFRRVFVIRTS